MKVSSLTIKNCGESHPKNSLIMKNCGGDKQMKIAQN